MDSRTILPWNHFYLEYSSYICIAQPNSTFIMEIFYHGSSVLFNRFDLSHVLEGDGKVKFGYGVYLTSSFKSAKMKRLAKFICIFISFLQ